MAHKPEAVIIEEPDKDTTEAINKIFDTVSVIKSSESSLSRVIPLRDFRGYFVGQWYQFYRGKPVMIPKTYEQLLRKDPTKLKE